MTPSEVADLPQGRFCQQGLINHIAFIALLMAGITCVGLAAAPSWGKLMPLFGLTISAFLFRYRKSIAFVEIHGNRMRSRNFPNSNWLILDEHTAFRSFGGMTWAKRNRQRTMLLALSSFYEPFGTNSPDFDELVKKLGL